MNAAWFEQLESMLRQMLTLQQEIASKHFVVETPISKNWYSPNELAGLIHRRPHTIRTWCRTGRITARKRRIGRGGKLEWEISALELKRFQEHGIHPKVPDDIQT